MAKSNEKKKIPEIIPVASGKGGVGKTLITANLGAALAEIGKKVLLVDSNFTSPNLHTFFRKFTLTDELFITKKPKTKGNSFPIQQTDIANLLLIPGNRYICVKDLPELQNVKFFKELKKLNYDYILIDMPAGWDENVIDTIAKADKVIYIIEPTPLSVESFYSILKRGFARRISDAFNNDTGKEIMEVILSPSRQKDKDMFDILDRLGKDDEEKEKTFVKVLEDSHGYLILNKSKSLEDIELGTNVSFLCERQFGIRMDYLGAMDYDDNVWLTSKKRSLLLSEKQLSVAIRNLKYMALSLNEDERTETK